MRVQPAAQVLLLQLRQADALSALCAATIASPSSLQVMVKTQMSSDCLAPPMSISMRARLVGPRARCSWDRAGGEAVAAAGGRRLLLAPLAEAEAGPGGG